MKIERLALQNEIQGGTKLDELYLRKWESPWGRMAPLSVSQRRTESREHRLDGAQRISI
jgi:hypothetical protein